MTGTPEIKKLSSLLLTNASDQTEVEKILNEIQLHFQEATDISGFDNKLEHLAAIPTAKGKALGLNHAAQCLLDYKRTVKFLQAIVIAIKEKQKKNPGKMIQIFYAGCGPYAPFVTLVAPHFDSSEIKFSLLEINKTSLESAKKLIHSLELADYIDEFYLADAVTFKVPNPDTFDMLISETLDAVLYRECYVPILFNMLPQFDAAITLIPENVRLNLKFVPDPEKNAGETETLQEYDAGRILDVREAVSSHTTGIEIPGQLPAKLFNLVSMDRYKSVLIDTEVHVCDDIWLHRGESSLTLPLEMKLEHPFEDSALVFTYQIDPEIELKYELQHINE